MSCSTSIVVDGHGQVERLRRTLAGLRHEQDSSNEQGHVYRVHRSKDLSHARLLGSDVSRNLNYQGLRGPGKVRGKR